ncbi:Transmembrane protease serine 9 [Papilio machaon]|uniref:Transmembrane protease serine 9 n=1 Tax=Papilio machaon TaxID=76193 RepID=A0A0N1IQ88_PAPMA|nr:Transmembrane protease serine 9 [Papilio machaon]
MKKSLALLVVLNVAYAESAAGNRTTYGFFREVVRGAGRGSGGSAAGARRVFGGAAAQLSEFPTACALLDRYFATRCSAAALASHWALTAAHCISPLVAYVKYNTRRPATEEGDVSAVQYLYRHPEYRVVQEDEGYGMDVTVLHNDVGLVRSRDELRLRAPLPRDALAALRRYDPGNLMDAEVHQALTFSRLNDWNGPYIEKKMINEALFVVELQVLGFGRSESSALGEEMWGARLRLARCGRATWYHVVCGAGAVEPASARAAGAGAAGGVCAGDSGGPLLFGRTQVAVTSLGPRECGPTGDEGEPPLSALSVFTTLRPYVDVLNATMTDTDAELRMRMISAAPRPSRTLMFVAYIIYDSLLCASVT